MPSEAVTEDVNVALGMLVSLLHKSFDCMRINGLGHKNMASRWETGQLDWWHEDCVQARRMKYQLLRAFRGPN